MLESFSVSGNLLFVRDSSMKFAGSEKQNLLSFRILIEISPADTLSETSFWQLFLQQPQKHAGKKIFC